jgi:hypothetical protein
MSDTENRKRTAMGVGSNGWFASSGVKGVILISDARAAWSQRAFKFVEYRFCAAIKAGSTKMVRWTSCAYVSICKSVSAYNKLILIPVLCLLSFVNQLFFNIGFRFGQRLVLLLYRDNLRAEFDQLRLHLQHDPIYFNLLSSLADPLEEFNRVACCGQGGRNFGEGHNSSSANVKDEPRRGAAPPLALASGSALPWTDHRA